MKEVYGRVAIGCRKNLDMWEHDRVLHCPDGWNAVRMAFYPHGKTSTSNGAIGDLHGASSGRPSNQR